MICKLSDICTITKGNLGIMKAIPGDYSMITLGENNSTHNDYQFDAKAVIIPLVSSTGHGHASMKRVKYYDGKFALGSILCAVIPKDDTFVNAKYLHIYLHRTERFTKPRKTDLQENTHTYVYIYICVCVYVYIYIYTY